MFSCIWMASIFIIIIYVLMMGSLSIFILSSLLSSITIRSSYSSLSQYLYEDYLSFHNDLIGLNEVGFCIIYRILSFMIIY